MDEQEKVWYSLGTYFQTNESRPYTVYLFGSFNMFNLFGSFNMFNLVGSFNMFNLFGSFNMFNLFGRFNMFNLFGSFIMFNVEQYLPIARSDICGESLVELAAKYVTVFL